MGVCAGVGGLHGGDAGGGFGGLYQEIVGLTFEGVQELIYGQWDSWRNIGPGLPAVSALYFLGFEIQESIHDGCMPFCPATQERDWVPHISPARRKRPDDAIVELYECFAGLITAWIAVGDRPNLSSDQV